MTGRTVFRPLIAFAALVLVAACESSGTLDVMEKSGSIAPGKTVALTVDAVADNPYADMAEVTKRVRAQLYLHLLAQGVFSRVVIPPEPADYKLDVKIQSATQVPGWIRATLDFIAGPFDLSFLAGRNDLSMSLRLSDERNGRQMSALEVTGESAAHGGSADAELEDAVREAVDNVIEGLR